MAVIGAGPVGSMAAKYAAKAGACTILLEEHAAAGWPVQCAGLLGRAGYGRVGAAAGLLHPARRVGSVGLFARRPAPGLQSQSLCKAWVVDRRLFDQAMLAQAVQEGANLRLRSAVRQIRREKEGKYPHPSRGRRDRGKDCDICRGRLRPSRPPGRHCPASDDPLRGPGAGALCRGRS